MLVWSSLFLPAPHLTFLVTKSFFSKSLRLCLFLKEVHFYPFLDYTYKVVSCDTLFPCFPNFT